MAWETLTHAELGTVGMPTGTRPFPGGKAAEAAHRSSAPSPDAAKPWATKPWPFQPWFRWMGPGGVTHHLPDGRRPRK